MDWLVADEELNNVSRHATKAGKRVLQVDIKIY